MTIPNSVISIGDAAFMDCSNLKSLRIGKGVTEIGEGAFSQCGNLDYIYLPKGLTAIGKRAFYGCLKLKYITIPETVTSLGRGSFGNCDNLVYVRSLIKDPKDTEMWLEPQAYMQHVTLTIPWDTWEEYESHAIWKDFHKIEVSYFDEKLYDVTGDGDLDMDDVRGLSNAILEKPIIEIDMKKANINNDFNVNSVDLIIMINLLNFGSPTPPSALGE